MDLLVCRFRRDRAFAEAIFAVAICFVTASPLARFIDLRLADFHGFLIPGAVQIGRASCRERV